MNDTTNITYQQISKILKITDADSVEIIKRGGLKVSKNQADSWRRSSDRAPDRYRKMPPDALEAFLHGLTDNKFRE